MLSLLRSLWALPLFNVQLIIHFLQCLSNAQHIFYALGIPRTRPEVEQPLDFFHSGYYTSFPGRPKPPAMKLFHKVIMENTSVHLSLENHVCFFFFVLKPHPVVLQDYSWLYTKASILAELREQYVDQTSPYYLSSPKDTFSNKPKFNLCSKKQQPAQEGRVQTLE